MLWQNYYFVWVPFIIKKRKYIPFAKNVEFNAIDRNKNKKGFNIFSYEPCSIEIDSTYSNVIQKYYFNDSQLVLAASGDSELRRYLLSLGEFALFLYRRSLPSIALNDFIFYIVTCTSEFVPLQVLAKRVLKKKLLIKQVASHADV